MIVIEKQMDSLKVKVKTLILGVGGGYDIYTCLPWFLSLTPEEQSLCLLANYSFTDDLYKYGDVHIVPVEPSTVRTEKNKSYFPEHHLAKSLNRTVYAIRLIPCPFLIEVLSAFVVQHQIQQIYMFDGGIDSVIFGNERPYGSPTEDSQTVLACSKLNIPCRLFVSALGVDDCDNSAYLKHWETFHNNKFELGPSLCGWEQYSQIVRSSEPPSIIQESIIAAGNGNRGRYKNLRLYPSRIPHEEDMPVLLEETNILWEWNLNTLVQKSPFYQHLLEKLPEINITDWVLGWIDWDHIVVRYLHGDARNC